MQDQNKSIPVVLTMTLLLGVGPLVAATPISCGMIIDTPGQYHLSSDLVCDSGVKVAAHDVHINMNGHALIGPVPALVSTAASKPVTVLDVWQ